MRESSVLHIIASGEFGGGSKHVLLLSKITSLKTRSVFVVQENSYLHQNLECDTRKLIIKKRVVHPISLLKIIFFIYLNSTKVIHAHGRGAAAVARLLKIITMGKVKIIYTLHGVHKEFRNKYSFKIYKKYERIFSILDDHRIFVSDSEEKEYHRFQQTVNRSAHKIIYNAIDRAAMDTPVISEYDVGVLTRFHAQKNLQRFVMIAKKLPEYKFVVGGDGIEYEKISSLIKTEKIENITLLGYCSNPIDFMRNIRLYLSTSLWEGLPYSVLEAIAHGKPVVLSDVVGHQDFKTHDAAAFLFRTDDQAVGIIRNLLENKQEYMHSVQVSYKLQTKFSYDTFISVMGNLYCGLINK